MLESIEIKNFKRIGSEGLKLNNLAKVNYLVGKNGSGKSSVLEYIRSLQYSSGNSQDMFTKLYGEYKEVFKPDTTIFFKFKSPVDLANRRLDECLLVTEYNQYGVNFSINNPREENAGSFFRSLFFYNFSSLIDKSLENTISTHFSDFFISTNFDFDVIDHQIKDRLIEFLNNTIYIDSSFKVKNIYRSLGNGQPIIERSNGQEMREETLKGLSSGIKQLLGYFINMQVKINALSPSGNVFDFVLIEEPETHLHPDFQKLLPALYSNLDLGNKVVIISTHSPFIISAAGEFKDTQKVYMIEDGQTVDLTGEKNTQESQDGYNGYQAKQMANKLLGAGLDDLHKQIVICEGEPNNRSTGLDAEIYNTIFNHEKYLFISAGGETQINHNAELAKRIIKNIFDNTNSIAFYLKDGDGKSNKQKIEESSKSVQSFGAEIKFLSEYAIECYLLEPEIVGRLYQNVIDYKVQYERWLGEIKTKFDHGKKLRLILDQQKNAYKFYLDLAKQITPETKTYKELEKCIFG
jgi:hypothetical protein